MSWYWLEKWSPRIWPLTFLISILILGIAASNLILTVKSNRPVLISANANFYSNSAANPPASVTINYVNVGKTSAHRAVTTLFSQNDASDRCEKLGTANIGALMLNQSTTIAPNGRGSSQIPVDASRFFGLFSISIEYFDGDANKYSDHFAYKLGTRAFDNSTTWLDEVPVQLSVACEAK